MIRDLSQRNSGDHKHLARCSSGFLQDLRQRYPGASGKWHAVRESRSVYPAAAHSPDCNSYPWHGSLADASGLPRAGRAQMPRHGSWLRGRNKRRVSDPLETAAAQGECPGTAPNFSGPVGWARPRPAACATGRLPAAHVLPPRHSDHGFRGAGNCTGSRKRLRTLPPQNPGANAEGRERNGPRVTVAGV